jgi:GNAT superfamily N-acetyltransferase
VTRHLSGPKNGSPADLAQRSREPPLSLTIEPNPVPADILLIERGLFAYEEARLGSPAHAQFAVLLRDDQGAIQGGLDGHVMWSRLFIKTLWLPESLRGRGLGSRLISEAEREAARRGCHGVWLTALGDRAMGFYLKRGYSVFGCLSNYVGGESLYSLSKDLPQYQP